MKWFGRSAETKSDPQDLASGGWVDLAECEQLWAWEGSGLLGIKGEALWRTPKGALVMRWADRYQTFTRSGVTIRNVLEWKFDAVTEEFATQVLLKRDTEGMGGHGEQTARRLFPRLFPADRWDPRLKK